ncbi:GNAT family N-acetyltransferase [Vagococcus fluvialis]|uniref:GNAT family N-acetyltransferase n=1 Tax=Vagococcus fluvialis TaxID=2738 RepID=UPI001A8FD277|nr:GNAT family N-acetyltransferase [Vagococcus fluvialis]MBO0486968.1 N-acetyltransferase [Vagococcus fluvialis]
MKYVLDGQRFVALIDNNTEAGEMTWSNAGESLIIIDHTFVDNAFRGQGIANELVAQGVAYARENNKKVMPLCPFAKKEFDRHPEYQDILH